MSLMNVTQMIEKEKQRAAPHEYWRCEKNQSNENEDSEEVSVFDNCLTDTETTLSFLDLNSENTDLHKGNKHADQTKDIEDDSDNIASGSTFFDDFDETDYFDSEDEYWDTLRNKNIKEEVCQHCHSYHLPRSTKDIVPCPFEEAYDQYPAFTPAFQQFAKENDFEIHDVYGDENCLFRAVADQFMVNGCPGHTEVSLRETVIKCLRKNSEKYDVHRSAVLSGETWEAYLQKMEKTRERLHRIFMQVLADVFLLNIGIFRCFHDKIQYSCVTVEPAEKMKTVSIFLGQVGEYHIFSFRPLKWMTEMPYKAQIFRMLAICTEKPLDERRKLVDRKVAVMSQGHFPKSNIAENIQFVIQSISFQEESRRLQSSKHTHFEHEEIFKSYNGRDLELEEVADVRSRLIEDHSRIDPLSGIPLPYLGFIMKLIFPYKMFEREYARYSLLRIGEIFFHYLGSYADQSCLSLRDVSRTQFMHRLDIIRKGKPSFCRVVVLKRDVQAIYDNDFLDDYTGARYLIVDMSNSYPGYCRLRLSSSSLIDANENVAKIGFVSYQKAFRITDKLRSDIDLKHYRKVECIGVPCYAFPFMHRWTKKRYDFPSKKVISSIIKQGCTLIPKPHPKCTCPDLEWQFNFSIAEHLLFKSLSTSQRHGFLVLKLLLKNMVHHTPFKTKHLKSVFFMACEEMHVDVWETNFSGCVLYVLSSLLSCLKANFLPHYFIPENNLIDCCREDDISTMSTIVEYIRLFPTCVIELIAEKYGFTYGANLIKSVLSKENYSADRQDFQATLNELFGHLTIKTAKVIAKMGFYNISLDILQDRFEQSLLGLQTGLRQASFSFCDFFMSALMEIRQKSSRVNLARTFDMRIGSNISGMVLQKRKVTLQTYLPWTVDPRLDWIEVPITNSTDFTSIASFLYDISKREYWRRNTLLAELTITTAIQCIQETLKQNSGSKTTEDVQNQILKRKLILFYMHVYNISILNFLQYPLINHLDEIEELCIEFPEIAEMIFSMCMFMSQPAKAEEYAKKFDAHVFGSNHSTGTRSPKDLD